MPPCPPFVSVALTMMKFRKVFYSDSTPDFEISCDPAQMGFFFPCMDAAFAESMAAETGEVMRRATNQNGRILKPTDLGNLQHLKSSEVQPGRSFLSLWTSRWRMDGLQEK